MGYETFDILIQDQELTARDRYLEQSTVLVLSKPAYLAKSVLNYQLKQLGESLDKFVWMI